MTGVELFVGLEVHKNSIAIADAAGGPGLEVHDKGTIPHDVLRLIKRTSARGRPEDLFVAHDAGSTGYDLFRRLREVGIDCVVVAPSKTPRRPGDRVKTDKANPRSPRSISK